MANLYQVFNGPMPTTAPVQKVTTGTSTKTMLQIVPAVPDQGDLVGLVVRRVGGGHAWAIAS